MWLLALFFAIDSRAYGKRSRRALGEDQARIEPLRVRGYRNMPLLLLVAGSVFLPTPARESVMAGAALLSYVSTPSSYHKHNAFSFAPMREVAILFAGIFVTMVPALATLHERSASLGITQPWQFFWITGGLSSILDNAPTYLAMLSIAQGLGEQGALAGVSHGILLAISAGAVLMGANTYIGNGPNFMVKAIAEHRGIRMPSFAVFSLQALAVMAPIYLAVTLLFLR
jgi:Na+/H+ antiporter NhaD/arsenite permease-like protein